MQTRDDGKACPRIIRYKLRKKPSFPASSSFKRQIQLTLSISFDGLDYILCASSATTFLNIFQELCQFDTVLECIIAGAIVCCGIQTSFFCFFFFWSLFLRSQCDVSKNSIVDTCNFQTMPEHITLFT